MNGDLDVVTFPAKSKLKPPSMFRVLLLNDDYTPMDFVVDVLESFFAMPEDQAVRIMMTVHSQGSAICGVYTKDVAETKVQQVNEYSRKNQHPLMCKTEKAT